MPFMTGRQMPEKQIVIPIAKRAALFLCDNVSSEVLLLAAR